MTDRTPTLGEWRGETTYLCPFCPFDTMSEEAINDHLRGAHPVPEGADPVEEAEAEPPVEAEPEPEPTTTPAPDVPVAPPPASTDDDE